MRINKSLITFTPTSGSGSGTVTSVALSAPTGFVVTGSPITSSGTLAITFASGYSLPTTTKQGQWDTAYNRSLTAIGVSGTTTKTLTLTKQDGTTLTASWTDLNTGTVTSVGLSVPTGLTVTGSPITTSGTLAITLTAGYSIPTTASQSTWDIAYSNRITSLTTSGSSGSSTLIGNTLNVPTYTLVGLGGMSNPFSAAIGQIIYSNSAGAPLSLLGNTTVTKKFLSQTGDGTNSAAPFWSTIAIGDVSGAISLTALSASSPLLYNNTTGVFSIQQASNLQSGFLSDANWTTFNSKQTQIALTTTGNSGASTFNFSTGALNIPQYTLAGLGGLSNPMTSLGDMIYGNAAGAPQRLVPNITTTRKYLSMLGDGTSGAIPTWETITGIAGSGTIGYISKFTGASTIGNSLLSESSNVLTLGFGGAGTEYGFEIGNGRTGNGFAYIDLIGDSTYTDYGMRFIRGNGGANTESTIEHRGTGALIIKSNEAGAIINNVNGANRTYLDSAGNYLVGTGVPSARFHVAGGGLAIAGTGFMVSSQLTNGRLETYDAGTAQCVHTLFDNQTYEISCGSTAGWVSGLVVTGRNATLLPDRVAIYTRSNQVLQVDGAGQLNLTNYTTATSFTGTVEGYLAFDNGGNIITSNPTSAGRNTRITFSAEVPNTWLSMPAAVTFFDNSTGFVTQADLTAYNQVRLIVNKQATAGAASSKIILRYQLTSGAPFTASSYSDIGTSEVSVAVNVANNILVSSWINMATAAKDDVWVTIVGIDGDGTISPQFGNIYAEFRFN